MGEKIKKEKLVILFNGAHLAYSPTVIGLYDFLVPHFDVTIVALSPVHFNGQKLNHRNVIYYKGKPDKESYYDKLRLRVLFFFSNTARLFRKSDRGASEYFHVFRPIKKILSKTHPEIIIAVDFDNLFYCRLLNRTVEFLSLEIKPEDVYNSERNFSNINSVIIQTRERYHYIFGDNSLTTFYIQNAPVFKKPEKATEKKGLIYCGTAWDAFGFYHCLEFLKAYPSEVMTVKGAVLAADKKKIQRNYGELIKQNRLVIDEGYIDDSEMITYLQKFRIGFCFYNFNIPRINTFNYHSAPSGKLFKYLAAGVPVVAVDMPGMRIVSGNQCGVLVEKMDPRSIHTAVTKIAENFDLYSANCLKVAGQFSFDRMVQPFIYYLTNGKK